MKIKSLFVNIRDWVWDKLFLDFYLDRRWTLRFKLMNFISGDTLREYISRLKWNARKYEEYGDSNYKDFHQKRVVYLINEFWKEYHK